MSWSPSGLQRIFKDLNTVILNIYICLDAVNIVCRLCLPNPTKIHVQLHIYLNTNELSLYKHYNSPETAAAVAYLNII